MVCIALDMFESAYGVWETPVLAVYYFILHQLGRSVGYTSALHKSRV